MILKISMTTNKEKKNFILKELIHDAVNIVRGTFSYYSIEVVFEEEEGLRCHGYANELQQVLVIMLSNAKDALVHTEKKSPSVLIKTSSEDNHTLIEVCDNGGGIDDKLLDKIFEPYFTTKYKSTGTGLGLYIAKVVIEESLHGELSVRNSQHGACFKIKIMDSDNASNKYI